MGTHLKFPIILSHVEKLLFLLVVSNSHEEDQIISQELLVILPFKNWLTTNFGV